jgi:copper oxidase (laccase) domain-containing protein
MSCGIFREKIDDEQLKRITFEDNGIRYIANGLLNTPSSDHLLTSERKPQAENNKKFCVIVQER